MNADKKPLLLIVDDNVRNFQFLGKMMAENGYESALARSGSQALDFVHKEKPELVLLDIMMPEMDGYEVCRELKSQKATSHIPVIFLTAKTETEGLVKGFEAGAVDYVTKPFKSAELLARIKTHIELKRAREEIRTLRGIIPICAKCKKIRDDEGLWKQIETYIEKHSDALFSHDLCPECSKEIYGDEEWFKSIEEEK
jgi:DNA-binding response OmpR family regulator